MLNMSPMVLKRIAYRSYLVLKSWVNIFRIQVSRMGVLVSIILMPSIWLGKSVEAQYKVSIDTFT